MNLKKLRKLGSFRLIIYWLFKSMRRSVPVPLARLLAIGNDSPLSSAIKLKTYDGSGQAVHPSVVSFQNQCYMACTPYPYSRDSYENPSVYVWEAEKGWTPLPGLFPLVKPRYIGVEHYSDPCLFRKNGGLHLVFRKCEGLDRSPVDQLYVASTFDGIRWTEPALLIEAKSNSMLSPAVACETGSLFCVDYSAGECDSRLICYPLTENASKWTRGGGGASAKFTVCRKIISSGILTCRAIGKACGDCSCFVGKSPIARLANCLCSAMMKRKTHGAMSAICL